MLPQDTPSNTVPWRVMVLVMQMSGCFPYRMSTTGDPPAFSMLLCLWAVFFELFRLSVHCMAFNMIAETYLTPELGTTVFICSCAFMFIIMTFLPPVLGVKSPELAVLLYDLSRVQGVSPPPTHRWYCRPKSLAFLSSLTFSTVFLTWCVTTTWQYMEFLDTLTFLIIAFSYFVFITLPGQLCSMVFGLLAHRLVATTQATVATVSTFLAHDGSVKCKSGMEAAMLALRDLDAAIREVEVQREKGTRCFFPVVTLYLLMAALLAIVCPYAILTGTVMGGITVLMLLIEYYMMFSFCHVGQAFVNEVSVAEGLLKDLRVKSQNHLLSVKVNQVQGSMSPMLTFNMCGWYRLDYASFLMLMNTVLTYVVIIFQVGGNNFGSLLSSSAQHSNSSAFQQQKRNAQM